MIEHRRIAHSLVWSTVALGALALTGCATTDKGGSSNLPTPDAYAELRDARGADRGRVDIFRDSSGLRLEVVARGFGPGTYGMHVHAVGQCAAPDFSSAGPHWNPTGAQHGRDNPMGAHHGDLPNLVVESGMIGRATLHMVGSRLTGEGGLLDADGAAFVIHAGPDDMRTDPAGNSGGRVACGVIATPAG
ncbi:MULTISPECIES: superoxide dismutase family protein [Sphingopyxis]|jgi:Cu-Zn family superoxide dismutase|uniref:Superoxide dismutase [Cu-Zn] n=1 Tax=Sphingopyxis granuli TaxID=267128 RepID=A0AA86GND2_9SPHN|nr:MULTISPECIES: superoxide dismutase family protein [Sphingopyxis]AMG76320.1 Superoxide dismutase Cu-Zn [Sphingopyxis granuli]APW73886.1 superoxide dismutase [Sphingopyxis granuli]ODU30028.1 MAG: superoxide dismutase [Sphingopyxis sp. SCN 67-31]UNK79746.1 superoxide dismutase family protein [Sphingopyxis granuli]